MATPRLDAFQVIADPSRREILRMLKKKSHNINSLSENFDMSRPAVSKHISILHAAGFITIRETGRERFCTLNKAGFIELQTWIDYFDEFWSSRLGKLEMVLKNKAKK
jgi:DNA-binding transcriptional ArsR family regulator